MSRHKSHRKRTKPDENINNNHNSNGGSLNFGNIAQLLSSIDINQVSSLINSINNKDTDKNSIITNMVDKVDNGENYSDDEVRNQKSTSREEIIRSINTLVNSDKSELLKAVMEIYGSNKEKNK